MTHNFLVFFASRTDLAVKQCLLLAAVQDLMGTSRDGWKMLEATSWQSPVPGCEAGRSHLALAAGGQRRTLALREAKHGRLV